MSLTGFDDSPLARHARIDLTSVAQGYLEQARVAVRLALERLEGGRRERCEIIVPTRLVVRGSAGQARGRSGPAADRAEPAAAVIPRRAAWSGSGMCGSTG